MTNRQLVISLRLFFGLLALAALGVQVAHLAALDVFNPANFFSYFTNLSNIFAALVLIISAGYLAFRRKPSAVDDLIRCAAVIYMTVTGTVYVLLLSGEDLGLLLPWVNVVLHYLMPLVILADWLYQPQRTKLRFKQTLWWLVFPLLYLTYSLIRGSIVSWYPYPFLDPDKVGGYGGVALYGVAILLGFFALSWIIRKLGRRLKRHIA